MSDTPSPIPEVTKPKLSLTPKTPIAPASTEEASSLSAPIAGSTLTNDTSARPPALTSSGLKPSFKLQGPVHAANPDKFETPKFASPMPAVSDDTPSGAIVALSAIAAAAALTFAVLLFLKTQ